MHRAPDDATLILLTRVAVPMKNTACLPPTPKYEMSLLRDRGAAVDDDDDVDDDTEATLGELSTLSRPTLHSSQTISGLHTPTSTGGREQITVYNAQGVFYVAGPSTWNSLPDSLRDPALSLNMFRRQLKTLFLRNIREMYSAL